MPEEPQRGAEPAGDPSSDAQEGPTETQATPRIPAATPKMIGQFHVKRLLASGGMGAVYEAVQEHPRLAVALKVMKRGVASRSAMRRFEYESQLLARLHHPAIAQVYEAGMHEDPGAPGEPVPFFAMEYIPNARPITEYAKQKKLDTRARLELFAQVCEAVHHGHQKGIIHRDLKPGNILVDSHGEVKIIDFGVARGTDSDLAVTTVQTDIGQLIGTLQYMSPEQCEADPHDIDTRSDVYALGVVLYELLAGKLPYDVKKKPVYETTRVIREQPPTRLSTEDATLKGDVETIAFKALEKDRERRYQSAIELAQDIRRYLAGEAIIARPPSIAYQLRVFARRNKSLAGAVVAVFAALALGMVGASVGLVRANRERAAAEEARAIAQNEANKTEAVNEFLRDMLGASDPFLGGLRSGPEDEVIRAARELTVGDLMHRASRRIDEAFEGKPKLEAAVRDTIGVTFGALGMTEEGEPHLRAAVEIRRRELGEDHPDTLRSKVNLGSLLAYSRDVAEGLRILGFAVSGLTRVLGAEHPETLQAKTWRGWAHAFQQRFDEAKAILRDTLSVQRRVLGEEHHDTIVTMFCLASTVGLAGDAKEGESIAREALRISHRVLGPNDIWTVGSMMLVGEYLRAQGRYAEAEPLLTQGLDDFGRILGTDHPNTLFWTRSLGNLLGSTGRLEEKVQFYEQWLERTHDALGEEHPETLQMMRYTTVALREAGRLEQAERLAREGLAVSRRAHGEEATRTERHMWRLAEVLHYRGEFDEAEELYRRRLGIVRRTHGVDHPATLSATARLSDFLLARGKLNEAEQLVRERLDSSGRALGEMSITTLSAKLDLASCLRIRGELLEAEKVAREALAEIERLSYEGTGLTVSAMETMAFVLDDLGKVEEEEQLHRDLLKINQERLGPDHPVTLLRLNNIAWTLTMQGQFEEAELLVREALEGLRRIKGENHGSTGAALDTLGTLLHLQGDFDEAEPLLRRSVAILEHVYPPNTAGTAEGRVNLARCLTDMGRYAEAEEQLLEAFAVLQITVGKRYPARVKAIESLVALYEAWGKPGRAADYRAMLGAGE